MSQVEESELRQEGIKTVRKPVLVISLDTELLWGFQRYPQHPVFRALKHDPEKGRGVINLLLHLFEKYSIRATWAMVGHLFLDSCRREDGVPHKSMPRFKEDWYSLDPCSDLERAPLFYGRDIVEKILESPVKHEIGYHSFSHVLFSECSREVAEAELSEGVKLAQRYGITLESFVFPQDKIGHLDCLRKYGFRIYRGRCLSNRNHGRDFLSGSAEWLVNKIVPPLCTPAGLVEGLWELPASMQFFHRYLPFTILPRVKAGVERAIRKKGIFHFFLHPGYLLLNSSWGKDLEKLLHYASLKRDADEIDIITMGELAEQLDEESERNELHANIPG